MCIMVIVMLIVIGSMYIIFSNQSHSMGIIILVSLRYNIHVLVITCSL